MSNKALGAIKEREKYANRAPGAAKDLFKVPGTIKEYIYNNQRDSS